ncbi:MAG: DUF563 domain-containing protein [Anaerolineales bacterium]|nr:DUF563 domain-containing protein [Anaerolineales bacterium]
MNSDPIISVVMITYNHEKYIAEAVNSILSQTYSDFELIIVDDGSSDGTVKIVQEYDDSRLFLVEQENSGPSIALNVGINRSRGQYIAFMSGDDVSLPNRLMTQIEQIELQEADMIFCLPQIIGPDSKILSNKVCPVFFHYNFRSTAELFYQLFTYGNFLCAPTCFCRKSAIGKIGQFKRGLIQLQDFDYWIRACKKNLVIKLQKEPVLQYRFLFGVNLSGYHNKNRTLAETTLLYRGFLDDAPIELLRNSFGEKITMDALVDDADIEIDKSFLFLEHSNPAMKAIGIERLTLQFEDEEIYKRLTAERDFNTSRLFQLARSNNGDTYGFARKLKAGLRAVQIFLLRYTPLMISEGPRWTKMQIERHVQNYLKSGENNQSIITTYVYKRIFPVFISAFDFLFRIKKIVPQLIRIIFSKILKIKLPSPFFEGEFFLSRMYDYSKQANSVVYEASPEKIYLKRPTILGKITDELFEGEAYSPRPYVSTIDHAIITGGSNLVILEETGELLSDEMVDFSTKDFGIKSPYISYRNNNKVIASYKKKPNTQIKEGILLSCDHDNNYFHWLVECLPKLVFIDDFKQFKDTPLLIPAGLHENLMTALTRVNINNHPIISLDCGVAYHVDRLIFPSALSRVIDRYKGRPVFDTDIILSNKWISRVSNLLKKKNNPKPWRKLYLTRRKGLRALGNQEEIERILSEYDFEIIDLEYASLDFQIKLFSQASMVVAPTGATLTNMLFCQPRTKVIIFMSNHETTNYYFWSYLGNITNTNITTIIGERLFNLTSYHSVHDDYIIDPNILVEEINKIERQ